MKVAGTGSGVATTGAEAATVSIGTTLSLLPTKIRIPIIWGQTICEIPPKVEPLCTPGSTKRHTDFALMTSPPHSPLTPSQSPSRTLTPQSPNPAPFPRTSFGSLPHIHRQPLQHPHPHPQCQPPQQPLLLQASIRRPLGAPRPQSWRTFGATSAILEDHLPDLLVCDEAFSVKPLGADSRQWGL